jgi:hypothetical protein
VTLTTIQAGSSPAADDDHADSGDVGRDRGGNHASVRLARRVWVHEVAVGVTALRAELAAIQVRGPRGTNPADKEVDAICEGVRHFLERAEDAAEGHNPRHSFFKSWWHGSGVEASFQNLHRAEAEIVRLYDDDEVESAIPEAVARISTGLDPDDPRCEAALKLGAQEPGPARRLTLRKTIQIGHELKDQQFTKIRKFRNIVLLASLLIAWFTVCFAVTVSVLNPAAVPFCFQAKDTMYCASGADRPSWLDVWIVALLGLLGGSLSAAVAIRNIRGTPSPYNLAIALAVLKVPTGALTAIGALVLLHGNIVPGFSNLDDQPQILAYALIFGYAQQLLTGLIDKRAHTLVASVPNKDVERARGTSQSRPPGAT